jgi:hypothetical protein
MEMGLLLGLIARRMRGLHTSQMARSAVKSGIAAAVMAAILWVWNGALRGTSALVVGAGGIAVGGVVYFAAALLLRAEEPRAMLDLIRSRWSAAV